MKAATFPDQRTGPLSPSELLALQALGNASPAPLMAFQVLQQHGTATHLGMELLRARGWVRLRGWPRMHCTRWAMTPRGLREAAAHPDLSGWGAWRTWARVWCRALVIWLRGQLRVRLQGGRA